MNSHYVSLIYFHVDFQIKKEHSILSDWVEFLMTETDKIMKNEVLQIRPVHVMEKSTPKRDKKDKKTTKVRKQI